MNQRPRGLHAERLQHAMCHAQRAHALGSVRARQRLPAFAQKPISANVRFSSRYVKYIVGADPRSALLRTVELCLMRTSSSEFGYGSGFRSTE